MKITNTSPAILGLALCLVFTFQDVNADDRVITADDLVSLDYLPSESIGNLEKDPLGIRKSALKEASTTLGIQGGIRWRYNQINNEIKSIESKLDFIFDFRPFMIKEKMMPPIISEVNGAYGIKEDGSAISSLTSFEIIQDAKLVATPPQWRDYLLHNYPVSDSLAADLKPSGEAEKAMWESGVRSGWKEGISLADRMAQENLNRLIRDYRGVIRAHRLIAQGVLTMPFMSVGDASIRINGKVLELNQRVFRITSPSSYNENPKEWRRKEFAGGGQ